jgi:2-polyprenyl-3-methyl-5-hydroxy-6-metoxy-1,4-benzoquinol methylase
VSAKTPYDQDFYESQLDGTLGSARQIVPLVVELTQPRSVLDVGCGLGAWLKVFRELGIEDLQGLDGDHVSRERLMFDPARFVAADLSLPFSLGRKFDLVVSLETAEHLPAESEEIFVDGLTSHSDLVLFSAAIPRQGGAAHVNERWQHHWAEKFQKRGFTPVDCIRWRVWANPNVEAYYAENMLLYALRERVEADGRLQEEMRAGSRIPLSLVHPSVWLSPQRAEDLSVRRLLRLLPARLARSLHLQFDRLLGRSPRRAAPSESNYNSRIQF